MSGIEVKLGLLPTRKSLVGEEMCRGRIRLVETGFPKGNRACDRAPRMDSGDSIRGWEEWDALLPDWPI